MRQVEDAPHSKSMPVSSFRTWARRNRRFPVVETGVAGSQTGVTERREGIRLSLKTSDSRKKERTPSPSISPRVIYGSLWIHIPNLRRWCLHCRAPWVGSPLPFEAPLGSFAPARAPCFAARSIDAPRGNGKRVRKVEEPGRAVGGTTRTRQGARERAQGDAESARAVRW